MNIRIIAPIIALGFGLSATQAFGAGTGNTRPFPSLNSGKLVEPAGYLAWLPDLGIVNSTNWSYDVYLGTGNTPVQNATTNSPEYQGRYSLNRFPAPPSLNASTYYYWRVDFYNTVTHQLLTGPVWWFYTDFSNPYSWAASYEIQKTFSSNLMASVNATIDVFDSGENMYRVIGADLHGTPDNECIVASSIEGKVCAYENDGTPLWSYQTGGFCFELFAYDIDEDGHEEVLATSTDANLYAFDQDGSVLWAYDSSHGQTLPKPPGVMAVNAAYEGSNVVVVAATMDGKLIKLDADGNELLYKDMHVACGADGWPGALWMHSIAVGDYDGNGSKEVFINAHPNAGESIFHLFNLSDFSPVWSSRVDSADAYGRDLVLLDVDKNGDDEVFCFGPGGHVHELDWNVTNEDVHPILVEGLGGFTIAHNYRHVQGAVGDYLEQDRPLLAATTGMDFSLIDPVSGMVYVEGRANVSFTDCQTVRRNGKDCAVLGSTPNGDEALYIVELGAGTESVQDAFRNLQPSGTAAQHVQNGQDLLSEVMAWNGVPADGQEDPLIVIVGMQHGVINQSAAPIVQAQQMINHCKSDYMDRYPYPDRLRFACWVNWGEDMSSYYTNPVTGEPWNPANSNTTISQQDIKDIIDLFESEGVSFIWGEHTDKLVLSMDTIDYAISNAPNTFLGIHKGEGFLEEMGDQLDYHVLPAAEKFIAQGGQMRYQFVWGWNNWAFGHTQEFHDQHLWVESARDGLSCGIQDVRQHTQQYNHAGAFGAWYSEKVGSHSYFIEPDDTHMGRQWSWAQVMAGHPYLRSIATQVSLGADQIDLLMDQDQSMPAAPRQWAEALDPILHMIGKGIIAPPRRDQLKNISPVMLQIDDANGDVLWGGPSQYTDIRPYNKDSRWWALHPVDDYDFTSYLWGSDQHFFGQIPSLDHGYGYVGILPGNIGYANTNRWNEIYSGDGNTFHHNGTTYVKNNVSDMYALKADMLADMDAQANNLPFRITGHVYSQVSEQDNGSFHVLLVDPEFLKPNDRTATILSQLPYKVKIKDRLTGITLGSLDPNESLQVPVPAASLRVLEISFDDGLANHNPVFTENPVMAANATEGLFYEETLADRAVDADGDPRIFSKVSGPAWLSVAEDGTISGTPVSTNVGLNQFNIQVSDVNGGSSTAELRIPVISQTFGATTLLAGWDGTSSFTTADQVNNANAGWMSFNINAGNSADLKSNGSSLTGAWGGNAALIPPPGTSDGKCLVLRSAGVTGTSQPYVELTLTAGTDPVQIEAIVFDLWRNWGGYGNDVVVSYEGGDLGIAAGVILTNAQTAGSSQNTSDGTVADVGVNMLPVGGVLGGDTLAPGKSATFRVYNGSTDGSELRYDNIAILGRIAQPAPPFEIWQSSYFNPDDLADPGVSDPAAMPMNDGIPNRVKYVLNLDPWVAGGIGPGWMDSNYWVVGFDRNVSAIDADLYLDMTDDLVGGVWQEMARSIGTSAMTATNGAVILQDMPGQTNGVQVRVPYSMDVLTNGFFRFRVLIQ